jgi:hypothetical protein
LEERSLVVKMRIRGGRKQTQRKTCKTDVCLRTKARWRFEEVEVPNKKCPRDFHIGMFVLCHVTPRNRGALRSSFAFPDRTLNSMVGVAPTGVGVNRNKRCFFCPKN